jgi:hypothetical protein
MEFLSFVRRTWPTTIEKPAHPNEACAAPAMASAWIF